MKVSKPSQITSQHFKWSKPFTSNWPNLERRDFGPDKYATDAALGASSSSSGGEGGAGKTKAAKGKNKKAQKK